MSLRAAAVAMAVVAAVLYFAAAVPMRRQAAAATDEFGRARTLRREAASRVSALERRNTARLRAMSAVAGAAAADPAAATRVVRRSVAQVLERSRAGGVNLAIRPGRGGVDVTLSARGPAADVLRLAGELARPDVGVVLERVQLSRASGEVSVQVQGLGVAGAP